ncbi:hypothetical protein A6D6_01091 [Alcanivorax xiamenensis]|uniref:Uncharacterized protein n=1 Tax=Alcanivorax xiamenensis TaxID=1177156 RepID=A0ABQ6YBU3_9GAMM|nr:hypothetical protein A6D6_01091 [Alcanivorax xiamenensis]
MSAGRGPLPLQGMCAENFRYPGLCLTDPNRLSRKQCLAASCAKVILLIKVVLIINSAPLPRKRAVADFAGLAVSGFGQ